MMGTRFAALATAFPRHQFPDENRTLSPDTGLTRAHWETVADALLDEVEPYRSAGGGRIDLPGLPSHAGVRSDGLEGFARTLLLAAFRHAGEPSGAGLTRLERYLPGLVAGTRTPGADDVDSWPEIGDAGAGGQPMVEAASIALALHLTQHDSWHRLSSDEQARLENWLRQALRRIPGPNNWHLFPLTVASFLEGVGRGDAETARAIGRGLDLVDTWYRGDGWYADGDHRAFDHYGGWALHFYPVLHAWLRDDGPLLQLLGARLRLFLESFALTFGDNGAPLYLGRSLTYRMATLASIALGAATGHTPLAPGVSRRMMSSTLSYFVERGAVSDGLLTPGWHGVHKPTLQDYSGPGSPYWASKGFLALMLPPDHDLWTAEEAEPQWAARDQVAVLPAAGLLIQRTGADGITRVHNHGTDNVTVPEAEANAPDPLYSRFAYSTHTGPTIAGNPSDNDLQLQIRHVWSGRRRIHPVGHGDDWIASWSMPTFHGVAAPPVLPASRVESIVAVRGSVEVRAYRLIGVPENVAVRLSGWAVTGDRPDGVHVTKDRAGEIGVAGQDGLLSQVLALHGWDSVEAAVAPAGTAFGRWARVPGIRGVAGSSVLVAATSLTAAGAPTSLRGHVQVRVHGDEISICWAHGAGTVLDFTRAGFAPRNTHRHMRQ